MAAKIETQWDADAYGNSVLLVTKKRGKLNAEEVGDLLRYDYRLQGYWVMIINAGESTCGAEWDPFGEEKQGDMWELYKVDEDEKCPVCGKVSPLLQYCPECGQNLIPKHIDERGIRSKSKAILDAIRRTNVAEAEDEEGALRVIDGILKEVII